MPATERRTIAETLREGARRIAGDAPAAGIDARALLGRRLGMSDADLAARPEEPVPFAAAREFEKDVERRARGEPLAYIVGKREFMGMSFITTPAALVPRPETEDLAETALAHILPGRPARALDLGAGCGAIGLSMARLRPQSRVLLSDCSHEALDLAQQNAAQMHVANASFMCGDWFSGIGGTFDVIAANPPYIARNDAALAALQFEPQLALCGGDDGLRSLDHVISGAPRRLRPGGILIVEHGATQEADVRRMFAAAGFYGIRCRRDLAGLPRVTLAARGR